MALDSFFHHKCIDIFFRHKRSNQDKKNYQKELKIFGKIWVNIKFLQEFNKFSFKCLFHKFSIS